MQNATIFIGIVPKAPTRSLVYAALDFEQKVITLDQGNLEAVLAFAEGQERAIAAICGPLRPNQGRMKLEAVRQALKPVPPPGRWTNDRVAEYLLRQHNLRVARIPADADSCPSWMKTSFELCNRLTAAGYQNFGTSDAQRQFMEVHPEAAYTALIEKKPFPKTSLEGRVQRQLILYDGGLEIDDPMRVFEEITRYRLKQGVLPLEGLYQASELEALMAAFTAWLFFMHPEQISIYGDSAEGQIVLPVAGLKKKYP
ncbi:MAG: DUF429 domain-containing protein [Chloroflexi bacterium]|jgi:hypothetical protein|nr:DUF429 domain-containing protein [Chloroflexota bacterium]